MAESISQACPPALPARWVYARGWTRYNADGSSHSVPFPEDDALVFDVEVLMKEGNFPTMATALSPRHW